MNLRNILFINRDDVAYLASLSEDYSDALGIDDSFYRWDVANHVLVLDDDRISTKPSYMTDNVSVRGGFMVLNIENLCNSIDDRVEEGSLPKDMRTNEFNHAVLSSIVNGVHNLAWRNTDLYDYYFHNGYNYDDMITEMRDELLQKISQEKISSIFKDINKENSLDTQIKTSGVDKEAITKSSNEDILHTETKDKKR